MEGMTMKFYTYKLSEQAKPELAVGDLENDAILYPLTQFDMQFADMNELIDKITPAELEMLKTALQKEELREQLLKISRADTIPCAAIPYPKQDVICLGINYMAHAEEGARYHNEAFGGEAGVGAVVVDAQIDYILILCLILTKKRGCGNVYADYIFSFKFLHL